VFSELGRCVAPLNRRGMSIAFGQVMQHALFQFRPILEVLRGQDVSLEGGEDQLHLIQPGGIDGEPMDADSEGQSEAANPRRDLLGRMGRPVVQDQVQESDLVTPQTAEEHPTELLEVHEALALKTAGEGLSLMDQQRGEEVENTLPLVAGADPQGLTCAGSQDATGHLQRLDAGLLIRAHHDRPLLDECVGLLIESQHDRGLLQEAGIRGPLPGTVLPGFDAVLA